MNNLVYILNELNTLKDSFKGSYYIPEIWNSFGFQNYSVSEERESQISVNPYEFISQCIEDYIFKSIKKSSKKKNYLQSIDKNKSKGIDLNKSVIFGMMPRMFTSWDHFEKGKFCSGTFLKAICLLPYLKKMNIDIIYLLPVFEYSDMHKKGELGSPYAIKNIYKIDKNLHDNLLNNNDEDIVEIEFKAFVEACHILNIRVMTDFVFRTCARDNDLIIEHPDWFYWINKEHNNVFNAPTLSNQTFPISVNEKVVEDLYREENVKEFINYFTYDPRTLDSQKWEYVINIHKETGKNIIELIEEQYNITTAPGFPDVINDIQPPWTDVTYLRLYYKVNKKIQTYIDRVYPPYIMQDSIKSNVFPGEMENNELWDYIANVIPHFQINFGIDGARIDMGHSLPSSLNNDIISRAKKCNSNFILWSEEFHAEKSKQASDDGFNFISGLLWSIYQDLEKYDFNKELITILMESELPVAAAIETADTPRAAFLYSDLRKLELLVVLNSFIPNAVPFINNGFEVMEIQPMNLGLGNTEDGKFVLEKKDEMFGKLAFFDNYQLHWLNNNRNIMLDLINKTTILRSKYIKIISKKENFIKQDNILYNNEFISLCYYDKTDNKSLFLIANKKEHHIHVKIEDYLPKETRDINNKIKLVYYKGNISNIELSLYDTFVLDPFETIICIVE